MRTILRKTLVSIYVLFFSYPAWGLIWLIGRTGLLKTVFLMYPTDKREYKDVLPNVRFIINYMSARPTPAGFIFNGWKPVGVYCCITNLPEELMKKKNRHIAETIVRRMKWAQKISGAKVCGFAGQLGPILERRHGIAMKAPFFSGIQGTIFGIDNSISFLAKQAEKNPWQLSIAVLGGGDLGEMIEEHFINRGYAVDIVSMTFKRRGGVKIADSSKAEHQLKDADFVINLLPTGDIFLNSGVPELLSSQSTIIDFARPAIPEKKIAVTVLMGNRIKRSGMRFGGVLPGDWRQKEFPACSLSSILASNFGVNEQNITKFCDAARGYSFQTALAPTVQPIYVPLLTRLQTMGSELLIECRFYLRNAREHFIL